MRTFCTFSLLLVLSAASAAQCPSSVGPDVIVGAVSAVDSYGTNGSGVYAYALGTTSCNLGNASVAWNGSSPAHPVIAQNIYRLKPVTGQPYSRFEQIGMSWVKHGFATISGSLCAPCQGGSGLGICCSDPYSASQNGSQGNSPRSDVNAATGVFAFPGTSFPSATPIIGRRIQCQAADVNPALNVGALYFGEGHYVTADDAAAGNKNNNASYRAMSFAPTTFNGSLSGGTFQQSPAIIAWQAADAGVQIANVDVPNDGRFIVARKTTALSAGVWHHEFAIHNLNSDRSGRGFTVNFPAGTTISNAGFRSIPYHSGELYSAAPWTITVNASSVNWVTEHGSVNLNANALRWGTTYNFWFDATAAVETDTSIELFKPAPCPADPFVASPGNYVLNVAAAFDNPTLTAPLAGPSGGDVSMAVPIGFTFSFYGASYTTVNVCTNGFLSFTSTSNTSANTCLPNAAAPNAVIAGNWDDLFASPGQITYQTLGVAPNRRFVAAFTNVINLAAAGSETFKIILDETTNVITSTIVASGGGGASATRGIENQNGTAAALASCNLAGTALAGTSQTYTFTAGIVPSASLVVTGSTGPGGILTWTINSNAKSAPVVLVASLDPGPLNLGPLGLINLGLSPGLYAVIADGAGVFGAPNPAHVTDWYCGDVSISIPLGPGGLVPGLTIYNQGVVIGPSNPPPPNAQFHITTPVTLNT